MSGLNATPAPAAHLPEWVRITDPELVWMAMAGAREGTYWPLFGRNYVECGGLELFNAKPGGPISKTQDSLACRIGGRRFVVVWWPQEPTEAPHVYHDTRFPREGGPTVQ